jgi:hypothetical protein
LQVVVVRSGHSDQNRVAADIDVEKAHSAELVEISLEANEPVIELDEREASGEPRQPRRPLDRWMVVPHVAP